MDERQEEREKESGEVEERTEEGTQETEEHLELTEEACEEESCEEDSESHSAAKRARPVCSTFTDSQETAIVEFVKEHPELYDKEHACFHDRQKKEALWAEISAELKLQPFDVRRWFESQRTHYGKLSKLQSGQAPREMTKRQSWVYQQMALLKTHIRRKGASRSSGFKASPNTSKQDESRGSTTDTEHLESSVLRESRSQPMFTSTPVSTDSKILEHFDQVRIVISGFLQQKSDRQPFFDYVASEAEKMTQEEFEDLKGRIFRNIESTPSPLGFGNPPSVLTVQDKGSRYNLSGILSQLPDLTSTQIIEQQQPQLFTITTTAPPQQQQPHQVAIQSGRVFDLPDPFQGHPNIPKTIIQLQVIPIPLPKHNSSVQILIAKKKSNTYTTPNIKQITHGTTHNQKRPHRKKLK